MIKLDTRLGMLAGLVAPCRDCADIGTDHGLLGAYLLENGICGRMQFLDISAPSLDKARRLIASLGLADRSVFQVGDGADALVTRANCIIIAGMGASTIAGIIRRGRDKLGDASLILQPNLGVEALRAALSAQGYRIEDERIERAAGRHYVAMRAVPGESNYSWRECLVGPVLIRRRDEMLMSYAHFRLKVLRRAYAGARASQPDKAAEMAREIDVWEEIVSC